MSDPRYSSSQRTGGFLGILLFLIFFGVAVAGGLGFLGRKAELRFSQKLADGMVAVEKDQGDTAFREFSKASAEMGSALQLYRKCAGFTGKTFTSEQELNLMMVSAGLMKIYNDLFDLQPSNDWVKQVEEASKNLIGSDSVEIQKNVATARELSALCELLKTKKYDEVLKGLLVAEKNAFSGDQDFFIMEIRLLIACGKGLKNPDIQTQARELLWFISSEAGVKGPKIDKLWGLLNR